MEKLKSIDIKGKEYVLINERVKYFKETYANGQILTEMLNNENGVCTFKASVVIDDKIVATGHAQEKEGSTFINKTSYIENAETSAVGRALGFAGIGIDTSIASAEEVQNAINNQNKVTDKGLDLLVELNGLVAESDIDWEDILKAYQVTSSNQLTEKQLQNAISGIKKKYKKE